MALLKEDGSLDIERIKQLPLDEHIQEVSHFTKEQRKEYISTIPINESKRTRPTIYGSLREELESGKLVDAWDVVNNI